MGEMGWGITFVLGMGAMVTAVLITLAIQYFRIVRLKMELKDRSPRDQVDAMSTQPE